MFTIPCTPGPDARWLQRTALDGADYLFAFTWNQRDGHWTLTLSDVNQVPIASGRKLVTGWRLLRGVVDPRRPPGELVVVDTLGRNDLDPGFSDLGSRFVLYYVTAADLAALVATA